MRRYGFSSAAIVAAIALLLVVFGSIQLASFAFAAPVAVPGTLPTRVPLRFALAVYGVLDRIAPAPYVESTLAAHALAGGDLEAALRHALRLPASPGRDELLARVALARGDPQLAFEYFLAAPDVAAVQASVDALAARDPAAAYAREETLSSRVALLATHPDAVAEVRWRMGLLSNRQAWREVPGSPAQKSWLRRAMGDFLAAADFAPLSEKYAIAAANQAMLLDDLRRSRALFARAASANPGSADALAGLGVVAYRTGDVAAARNYLERARRIDPHALMVRALDRDLRR
ncbi:MAG TPA: tetratricopeptide repeat protein [Candidatus Tumulicola sp.]